LQESLFDSDDLVFVEHLRQPPQLPIDWVTLVCKLHPITAIVVWEVMTGSLTPATITLAQSSPDWDRYLAIRIVGSGNPEACADVASFARQELDEIFRAVIPGYKNRLLLN